MPICRDGSGSGTLLIGLSLVLLLLLASLPLLSDFLELFRSALLAMRLHGDVSVEMVQGTIGLFTAIPTTLVHALDLFISSTRTLVLLGAWDRDEGVNL